MSISLGDLGTAIINDKNLAIYPTQTNNAGKFLSTDGTDTSWADGGGNTDGFLSGLTVSGSGSNGLDLAFTRNNDTNINFSIPKYTIHTTAFNDGTLTIQQFHNNDKTVDILPTQSSNSGKFLSTDGTTLSWSEASGGGGPTWTDVDVSSNSFEQNLGIGRGDRRLTWMIEEGNFFIMYSTTRMTNQMINGLGAANLGIANDNDNYVRNYGFFVLYPVANEAYNFTKLYLHAYDVTIESITFVVEGSNDKHQWSVLHTCTGTHAVNGGSAYNYISSGNHATREYSLNTNGNYYHYWRFRLTNTGTPGNGDSITQTYQYLALREVMFS